MYIERMRLTGVTGAISQAAKLPGLWREASPKRRSGFEGIL